MKKEKGIRRKCMGKTAVVSAVFIMILTMAVLSGCQNSSQGEISSGDVPAEAAELQINTVSRADAEQLDTDHETVQPETETQAGLPVQETQPVQEPSRKQADASGDKEGNEQADKKEPPAGWELTLASEDWGLSFGESGTQPVGNASPEDLAWYDAYYVGDDSEKVIYLTFDCGYENGNTEPILDALQKHDVQATFFVVGHFLETAPDLAKRMVEDGHAVGNHTYHHLDMPAISDQETFQKEMDDVADLFHEITGAQLSPYYRPPQGKCNVNNLKMAQESGYNTIFWSLAYVDWNQDDQPGREEALDKLTSRIHPGAIVLLHNTSSTNGEILDELLTKWEEMGYTFKLLSELTDDR